MMLAVFTRDGSPAGKAVLDPHLARALTELDVDNPLVDAYVRSLVADCLEQDSLREARAARADGSDDAHARALTAGDAGLNAMEARRDVADLDTPAARHAAATQIATQIVRVLRDHGHQGPSRLLLRQLLPVLPMIRLSTPAGVASLGELTPIRDLLDVDMLLAAFARSGD